MKIAKKFIVIISLLLAATVVFSLSSCYRGYIPVEIKLYDMFTDEEQTFHINQRLLVDPQPSIFDDYYVSVWPKKFSTFDEISISLRDSGDFRSSSYSENVVLFESVKGRMIYCLTNDAVNTYTLSNPFVKTYGYKTTGNTSEKVSENICFPFYLLEKFFSVGFNHEFQLDKEYEITCTKEKMKEFYVNLNKFNVEDMADGFLVNGFKEEPKVANRFSKMGNYKFIFSEKGDDTFLVLSNV